MKIFKKFLYLLNKSERKMLILLLFMILGMAFIDMIGVASILPFLVVLTNPDLVSTNEFLKWLFDYSKIFGVENQTQYLIFLGFIMLFILIFSITFKTFTTYFQIRFVQMRQYSLSKRLIEGYLHQPYSWFLNINSADLGKTILHEVGQVIGQGINPMLELISKSAISISIIILLIIVDPVIAIVVGFSLVFIYGSFYYFIKNYLNRIGKESFENNQSRFRAVLEAFNASKEIKVGNLENVYVKRFSDSALTFAKNYTHSSIISSLPRYVFEGVAFGGILSIMILKIMQSNDYSEAIPIVGLYAFAGYRLMPAIHSIFSAFTSITFVKPVLDKITNDLKNINKRTNNSEKSILPFKKKISLKKINYDYPNSSRTALNDLTLNISAGSKIGLVGATGSGKTTTIDIILGLLEPQNGVFEVDENIITQKNLRSWQRSIGYVPQNIYLSDDTISANIAFGKESKDINQLAVEKAAKIANIHNFIFNELPEKYQTKVGERGVRLSGGQLQRIGIARAIYNNPQLLILDEATNALDNQTEKNVMDAINNLNKNTTIIIIAHRLSTVKNCDNIFLLDKGRIVNHGTYNDLINKDKDFAILAKND